MHHVIYHLHYSVLHDNQSIYTITSLWVTIFLLASVEIILWSSVVVLNSNIHTVIYVYGNKYAAFFALSINMFNWNFEDNTSRNSVHWNSTLGCSNNSTSAGLPFNTFQRITFISLIKEKESSTDIFVNSEHVENHSFSILVALNGDILYRRGGICMAFIWLATRAFSRHMSVRHMGKLLVSTSPRMSKLDFSLIDNRDCFSDSVKSDIKIWLNVKVKVK